MYVYNSNLWFQVANGRVRQISHTCEAGYGFPSGHTCILVCAVVSLYVHGGLGQVLQKVGPRMVRLQPSTSQPRPTHSRCTV